MLSLLTNCEILIASLWRDETVKQNISSLQVILSLMQVDKVMESITHEIFFSDG